MASRRKTASISAPAGSVPAPPAKRRPGRPPVHEESWTKATVVLFDRQIDFLDDWARRIRGENGASVSRAQLIRALVDAAADAGIDLTAARSEAELKATVLRRLRAYS